MKTLIVYVSIHHGNTEKIAKVIAKTLKAKLVKPSQLNIKDISKYDLIGFGSGIFFRKHHRSLLEVVDKIPLLHKNAFIFSTAGMLLPKFLWHNSLRKKLTKKGFKITGEFSCRGWDTFGPFQFFGGLSKGHPNKKDIENARNFAENLKIKNFEN